MLGIFRGKARQKTATNFRSVTVIPTPTTNVLCFGC